MINPHVRALLGATATLAILALTLSSGAGCTSAPTTATNLGPTGNVIVSSVIADAAGGKRTLVNGISVLHTQGEAETRGLQHGKLYATEIAGVLDGYMAAAIEADADHSRAFYDAAAAELKKSFSADAIAELTGIAEGSGRKLDELVLWNCWLDIAQALAGRAAAKASVMGEDANTDGSATGTDGNTAVPTAFNPTACAAFAVVRRTATTQPMLCRTLDVGLRFDDKGIATPMTVVQVVHPTQGKPYTLFSWPGLVGAHMGTNLDGLAIATCSVPSAAGLTPAQPLWITLREVIANCANVPSATEYLLTRTLPVTCNIVLVDTADRAATIECAPQRNAIREAYKSKGLRPGLHWAGATNHFVEASMQDYQLEPAKTDASVKSYRTLDREFVEIIYKREMPAMIDVLNRVVDPAHTTLAIVLNPFDQTFYASVAEDPLDKSCPYRHVVPDTTYRVLGK